MIIASVTGLFPQQPAQEPPPRGTGEEGPRHQPPPADSPQSPWAEKSYCSLGEHLPPAPLRERAARTGHPWRGLPCSPSCCSSGTAAPGPQHLRRDKAEQPQAP